MTTQFPKLSFQLSPNSSGSFELFIVGKGWEEKLNDPNDEPAYPSNRIIMVKVKANDTTYPISGATLLESALIIRKSDKMPKRLAFHSIYLINE